MYSHKVIVFILYIQLQAMISNLFMPENKEELFNLRHAQLHHTIECTFGNLKKRFRILLLPPEYNFQIQAKIPVALATIHNFIIFHEPYNVPEDDAENIDEMERHGNPLDLDHCASSLGANDDKERDTRRETNANEMWRG